MLLREFVHLRPGSEVVGRLGTAVQHHDERERLASVAARNVELVRAAAGLVGIGSLFKPRSVWKWHRCPPDRRPDQAVDPIDMAEVPDPVHQPAQCLRHLRTGHGSGTTRRRRRAELGCRPSASDSRSRRHHVQNGCRTPSRPAWSIALGVGWSGAGKASAQDRQSLLEASVAGEAECFHRVDLRKCVHRSRSFVERIAAKRGLALPCRREGTVASVRAFRAG